MDSQPKTVDHRYNCCMCGEERFIPVEQAGLDLLKETPLWSELKIACPKCELRHNVHVKRMHEVQVRKEGDVRLKEKISTWIPLIYQNSDVERFPKDIWQTHKH
ncbi:MAG: hypothetical protein ACWGQW_09615, partial [bacterium]